MKEGKKKERTKEGKKERKKDRKKERRKKWKKEERKEGRTERQKDRKTERQKDRKTERQKERKKERKTLQICKRQRLWPHKMKKLVVSQVASKVKPYQSSSSTASGSWWMAKLGTSQAWIWEVTIPGKFWDTSWTEIRCPRCKMRYHWWASKGLRSEDGF